RNLSAVLNKERRRASAYCLMVIPVLCLNARSRVPGFIFSSALNCFIGSGESTFFSTARQTFRTNSSFPDLANSRGLQRRQARNPACSALSGSKKNCTFSGFGRREAHDGRQ